MKARRMLRPTRTGADPSGKGPYQAMNPAEFSSSTQFYDRLLRLLGAFEILIRVLRGLQACLTSEGLLLAQEDRDFSFSSRPEGPFGLIILQHSNLRIFTSVISR